MLKLVLSPIHRAIPLFFLLFILSREIRAQEMAVAEPVLKETMMERPANVVYPEPLQQAQQYSIDYVAQYAEKKRARLHDITRKGKKYFPGIVKTFAKYQVPEELKVLIVLESDFNPNVISWAGAVGYWQFMDATAKEYGLNIITREEREALLKKKEEDKKSKQPKPATALPAPAQKKTINKKDDRNNLAKSTRAAARYLQNSLKTFDNDLLLAVASYNCGPGNVKKAQQKSGVENAGFWDIKECLPAETRNYVMNFIALNVLLNNYTAYNEGSLRFKPETIKVSELLAQEQLAEPAVSETPQQKNKRR